MSDAREISRDDRHVRVVVSAATSAAVSVASGTLPPAAAAAAEARAWLGAVETAEGSGDHTSAEAAARAGLDVLGDSYRDPTASVTDDTSIRVLGADKTDDIGQRVTMLQRALESRLEMFAWRYEPNGISFDPPVG